MNESREEEIVVSGISGRFPKSKNVHEFSENLYNKTDMVDDSETRWKHFHPEVPKRTGKIGNLEKFDASFFSIHHRLANSTDPQARILLEHSYEAILDAGISPQTLVGSRTGVFIGCSASDSKDMFLFKIPTRDGHAITGNANFYTANRISFALGLCGPSLIVDTACSSSAYALDLAFKYMKNGTCDSALVGGAQLLLSFSSTTEYKRLRVLAPDGICSSFDKKANGFVRADAICVIFLQKAKDSKRIYANILNVNTNNDGFKSGGSSFPSRIMQQQLFEENFSKINLDPNLVEYVEAHSTGTIMGDAEEVAAIDGAYCKKRKKPLAIGSVKSNMGHSEATAALASTVKLILSLENQKIPPNINLHELNSEIPAFTEKRIKVVTEVEKLNSPFVSMNSFGLGGANAHAIFKGNLKSKIDHGIPVDNLNRLVCWAGRTEAAVNSIFDDVSSRPLDAEHIALLQNTQVKTTSSNTYRGFGMFAHDKSTEKALCLRREIQHFNAVKKPIVWVYSGIGSQWVEMGTDLMKLPTFAERIDFCHNILSPKGINLKEIITSDNKNNFENVLNSYVGIVAIEMALTDVLKALGLEPDFIIGHSVGELGCAYCDGCLSAEETILAAYARGQSNNESKTILGGMAAVGMSHKDLIKILPKDMDVACHNAADSSTISGPALSVKAFVSELSSKNVFAKEISCSGVPLHSRYIKDMGDNLMKKLKTIIKNPKKRSAKWISSTFIAEKWTSDEAKFSGVEYHTKNLLNPVLFEEVLDMLPKDALTIEIAPHGLLNPILKRSMKEGNHFSLTQRDDKNGIDLLTKVLGQIFQQGIDLDVSKLYPPVEFPVSRGTPMISPHVKWDHSEDFFVPQFISHDWYDKRNVLINVSDKEFEFIQGHIIDGKNLFPGTGLICLVWETFAMMQGVHFENLAVTFEEVKFLRATSLQKTQDITLSISIHRGSGLFEITEGQSIVALGRIKSNEGSVMTKVSAPQTDDSFNLVENDFYKEMRLRGYNHKGLFRTVVEARDDGLEGLIQWKNNWTAFIDCLLQFEVLMRDTRNLVLPTKFRKLVIDPKIQRKLIIQSPNEQIKTVTCPYTNIIQAGGVEIHEFEGSQVNRRRPAADPVLEIYKFVPHFPTPTMSDADAGKFCAQLLLENLLATRVISIEIDCNDNKKPLSEFIFRGLSDLPMITFDLNYLTTRKIEIENLNVQQSDVTKFENVNLIVKTSCLADSVFLKQAKQALSVGGFILSRENINTRLPITVPKGFQHIANITTDSEVLLLLQLVPGDYKNPDKIIKITSKIDKWLEPLKAACKSNGSVLVYSQNEKLSGILGLVNCVRREISNSFNLTCVLIDDPAAPPFDINHEFYKSKLQQGCPINVFKRSQWGSYRHLQLKEDEEVKQRSEHYCAQTMTKGDTSSLTWFKGRFNAEDFPTTPDSIRVQYSALNFRDVMQASGKISFDNFTRIRQQYLLGHEFAGVRSDGTRVFGLATNGAFTTYFNDLESVTWNVPSNWSLSDAATVPLVYSTVYLAFFFTADIKSGESVLIHAGSGGVGLAALHVAFHHGLEVFTTVGTEEKRNFLLKEFPLLKPENIGNSRDTTFEQMVIVKTKGRGVDYVLNSLSEDKLLASLRCVAENGMFLEIGKFDILNKTKIDLGFLTKKINIRAIFVQGGETEVGVIEAVHTRIKEDVAKGVVKPLNTTIFAANEIQDAFRYLASGKHIGKVLIRIRENENDSMCLPIAVKQRVFCDETLSYVIVGGLGGFGMELADWLVLRGCKKLILSSSRGITNGYQAVRLKLWQSYGVRVAVSIADVTTMKGCEQLIREASDFGSVGGIFNLAVILRDALFENQNSKMFKESFGVKAEATKFLDELSRELCPNLRHFVIFSSVSCGRGNAGQSNYGMANSIMEKIIEQRHENNLPAKAIQWGAVGDVGLLADLQEKNVDMQISGTLPQRITSCLEVLDCLLTADEAIVGSMVVAEKQFFEFKKDNALESIFNILGIRDKKSISMDAPLSKLGMDSLMTVEITQLLEREFTLYFTLKELQSMTLHKLEQLTKSKRSGETETKASQKSGLEMLLRNIRNEQKSEETVVCLKRAKTKTHIKVLIIPGIEGCNADVWDGLAARLDYEVYILQLHKSSGASSLREIHDNIIQDVLDLYADDDVFFLVGFSFGTLLALNIAKTLESRGRIGKVTMIDGSPLFFKRFTEYLGHANTNDEQIQNEILTSLVRVDFTERYQEVFKEALSGADLEEKLDSFLKFYRSEKSFEQKYSKTGLVALFKRFKMIQSLSETSFPHLKSTKISLVVPSDKLISDITENYNLDQYSSQSVETLVINGNHLSILQSIELSNFINSFR